MSNRYFEHQELIKRFKILATKELPSLRIFDRTVGMFYARRYDGGAVNYVPVKINRPGMADAYGVLKTSIGMIHLEFEFKSGNAKQTPDQKTWENFISNMGGFFLLIRNEHEAIQSIKEYINGLRYKNIDVF